MNAIFHYFKNVSRRVALAGTGVLLVCGQGVAKNDNMYQEQPSATSAITFDGRGFIVNGQRTFIASGDMHYPRVPQALWHDRLLRLKRSGLNCVQTYVFMDYHSPQEGVYDFSGEKDFSLYLRDINDLGLYSTMRVGMYVCSEWDDGGYPEWLLLKPGLSLRTAEPQFLAAHDSWYGRLLPMVSTNQINHGGSVILVQLDNEHPSCWGIDTGNQTYFTHLRTNALALGIEVPMFFSGLHHAHAPAGTAPFDSVGRTTPWYTTEFWSGWFNLYGGTVSLANTYDRDTWQIIAYGGNGYNYYMFHGGSNFDHWNANGIGASYDYGAALGQAGDFRPLYYRDKRAALFARSFQAVLENSTNASAAYASAATGVSAISARGSPAGTILFLDNNTAASTTAVLNNGAQMKLEAYEIAPVVKNFALTRWLIIQEADARIFGVQPQGNLTTLVLYGLPGESVRVAFSLTNGAVTYADPAFTTNGIIPANVTFSSPVVDGTPKAYQLVAGTNSLRVLVMSKTAVDRTWFVDSAGSNYVVTGAAYVGEFTNGNGQITCSLEEPVGNALPTNLLVFDGTQFAARILAVTNQISSGPLTPPVLANWQMRPAAGQAAPGYDDSAWFTTNTPPLMGMDGDAGHYAWYRAVVTVSNSGSYMLNFTGINDWGTLFVNGQQVPMTSSSSAFSTPVTLLAGTNILAIFTSQTGRDALFSVTGTSATAFTPRGLLGPVTLATSASTGAALTNWYWLNVGTAAPSAADVATMTATNLDPVAGGWNTGSGWNANIFSGAGYAWFRSVLPTMAGGSHSLHFTNVDDNCTVYLNGTNVVGSHTGWGQSFDVSLNAAWRANGSNILTILVQNTAGGGGLNGTIVLNAFDPAGTIASWKLQGGVGPADATNLTWQPLASATGLPVFYRATFNYQPPAGVLPILRAGWSGLSAGFIWLNGHLLGRYPETIPVSSIYLPECWLSATNELVVFEEQGKAPGAAALTVETTTSRQLLQCTASTSPPTNILAPTGLNAVPGNQQIQLAWSAANGATNYTIWRGTNSGSETVVAGTTIGTAYTDADLVNGLTYYYVVTAAGTAGSSGPSAETSAAPIAPPPVLPPGSLNASPGDGQITLVWAASAGATNYSVWRGTNPGNESAKVVSTVNTDYTDFGLNNGTTYYYVVTAAGPGSVSSNSPEAFAAPFVPTNVPAPASLTAYPGNARITLVWAASTSATNYTIWDLSGADAVVVGLTTNTLFSDTGLVNGTTYFYAVTAAGANGTSEYSPEAYATPTPTVSGAWTADASGNWSDLNNWFGGIVADGFGQTADFSGVDITGNRTVILDGPHTLSGLAFGDTVPDHGWTISGANILTLGSSPVVAVVNQSATISSVIAGSAFTKTGAGTLILNGSARNTFSGILAHNAGALTEDFSNLSPATDLINNSVAITMAGSTLNIHGAATGATSQTFAGTTLTAGPNIFNLVNNGASASLSLGALTVATKGAQARFSTNGSITTTTSGKSAMGVLGGAVGANSTAGYATYGLYDWATTDTGGGGAGASPYTIIGLSAVTGGYVTTFPGTGQGAHTDLQANYTVGANTGTTTVRFNTPSANILNVASKWFIVSGVLVTPNMGAVNCTIAGSGGGWFGNYSTANPQNEYVWQNNTRGFLNLVEPLEDGRNTPAAALSYVQGGPGTVMFSTANTTSGQYYLNGGCTVITTDGNLGYPATAAAVNLNGGALVGNATFTLDNGGGLNPRPIILGSGGGFLAATAGNTFAVDGIISGNGSVTIGLPASDANNNIAGLVPGSGSGTANAAMNATGTVLLSGVNTYAGNTTVMGGTLLVTNTAGSATGSGAVTIASGGTLSGSGIIAGAVTVNAGGTLAPGNPLGVLTISNNLMLTPGGTTIVGLQHSPLANGSIAISGMLIEDGTLYATNLGVAAFAAGDSFKLFSAAGYSGSFAGFVLPPLPGNLVWNTNTLKTSGTLSAVSLTRPVFGGLQITGDSLVISGSGGVSNWPFVLLACTNLAAAQWTPVLAGQFDAAGNFTLNAAHSSASTQTFYRLQLQ